jgi:hypothetical protein
MLYFWQSIQEIYERQCIKTNRISKNNEQSYDVEQSSINYGEDKEHLNELLKLKFKQKEHYCQFNK